MGKYNIVFASDKNYLPHLGVAIYSLLKNNEELELNLFLINSGIELQKLKKIEAIAAKFNSNITNVIIDDALFDQLIKNNHFTNANYYRLLIPELINEEKVLYLDSDIIINNSIIKLLNFNINNSFIAAVEDPTFIWQDELKMDKESKYFNSGVMLINLRQWSEIKLHKSVIDFINNNPKSIRFVDQCGLNAVLNGNWQEIELKYNQQSCIFEDNFESNNHSFNKYELKEAKQSPVIIHYTGSSKPWQFRNKHPYKKMYWKYLKQTPYYHTQLFKYYFEILKFIPSWLYFQIKK